MTQLRRHIATSWRRPSEGRPYSRCPVCRCQIFADVTARALPVAILMQLHQRTLSHLETEHPS
jgi:hypothetical protein